MKQQFNTRFGAVAAAVGSAVGLGNIWRFPYEAGANGGAAFIFIYIFFICILGIPVILAEFMIGRGSRSNVYGAFKKLGGDKMWSATGYIGLLTAILILSFYSVVAGWTASYLFKSFVELGQDSNPHQAFGAFTGSWHAVGFTLLVLAVNWMILRRGVQRGIERASNFLMPVLFVLLILFCIRSLTLPGASEGLRFLFLPDVNKVTPSVILNAMGQAFFSLSIGLGCLITYSSYFSDRENLVRSACTIGLLDTLVAILAGIIIFPAVFSFGQSPAGGPTLVFEVLPSIFADMSGGMFWSALFFLLLFVASISSTISMGEIPIAYLIEQRGMSRTAATSVAIGICALLGTLCSLSFGPLSDMTVCGLTVFNLFDSLSSNILMPIGGIFISLYAGNVLSRQFISKELGGVRGRPLSALIFILRYICPLLIAIVFVNTNL